MAALTYVEAFVPAVFVDELQRHGQRIVRDPLLDGYVATMAEVAASNPTVGTDISAFFDARDMIDAEANKDVYGYGYTYVATISPATLVDGGALHQRLAAFIDKFTFVAGHVPRVGIGTYLARGRLLTYFVVLP